jgi:PadR family transcriptional regulator, regulatory protein PadR
MKTSHPRMTTTTVQVLELLAEDADTARYGLEIMARTGLPSGTIFPILARFEALGWLASGWEAADPSRVGRPRRRYYRLTTDGLTATTRELARVDAERRRRASVLRAAPGISGGST